MIPSARLVLHSKSIKPITPIQQSSLIFSTSRHQLSTTTTTTTANETSNLKPADRTTSQVDDQWKSHQKINPTIRKAFQESIQFLKNDAEKLKSQLDLINSTSQHDKRNSGEEELEEIERLRILSQINDFQIRRNHHLGHQVDMSKPIYRFLEQQRWRKEGRLGRLMETAHRLRIFPDLYPSFDPQVDLKVKFQSNSLDQNSLQRDRFVNIGNFVPSSRSTSPPTIQVQVFHEEPRLYTIMMVDPDVPDPENHTFTSFLHWLVPNVPISATTNGDLGLNSEVQGDSNQKIDYIGPHPAEGSGHHRYTILIFEQANNSSINITDHPECVTRVGFSARKMSELFGLKPVGVLAWASQWDPRDASFISSIYSDQLKIPEPRYGREPKPFNPRVKLPPHSHLPLTHRHPPVIPWREKSSAAALET